jgi:hypothetical protein
MGNYTFPILEYSHSVNGVCAVTGGYVYHGSALPQYAAAVGLLPHNRPARVQLQHPGVVLCQGSFY